MVNASDESIGESVGSDPLGNEVLIQEELVADSNADLELGGEVPLKDCPGDDEIDGSRFTLVRYGTEKLEEDGNTVLMIALDASFHPAPAMRISHAQIEISLTEPPDAVLADIAPREVLGIEPVVFRLSRGANLNLTTERAEVGLGRDATTETTRYHCQVKGIGVGTGRARWTLYENEFSNGGIGSHQRLILAVTGQGPFKFEAMISCNLVREGLPGITGRVRELILGPHMKEGKLSSFIIDQPTSTNKQPAVQWYERESNLG